MMKGHHLQIFSLFLSPQTLSKLLNISNVLHFYFQWNICITHYLLKKLKSSDKLFTFPSSQQHLPHQRQIVEIPLVVLHRIIKVFCNFRDGHIIRGHHNPNTKTLKNISFLWMRGRVIPRCSTGIEIALKAKTITSRVIDFPAPSLIQIYTVMEAEGRPYTGL